MRKIIASWLRNIDPVLVIDLHEVSEAESAKLDQSIVALPRFFWREQANQFKVWPTPEGDLLLRYRHAS